MNGIRGKREVRRIKYTKMFEKGSREEVRIYKNQCGK